MKKILWITVFILICHFAEAQNGITKWEYWFDQDYPSHTSRSFPNPGQAEIDEILDISGLPHGLHTLHSRFRDGNGTWSPVTSSLLYKYEGKQGVSEKKIIQTRFWFDNDYEQAVTDNTLHTEVFILDGFLDVISLADGLHTLHFMFRDDRGIWSPVQSRFFAVYSGSGTVALREVVQLQYWFDQDFLEAVNTPVTSGTTVQLDELTDVTALDDGLHSLHYRFRDTRGIWGPVQSRYFVKYPWSGTQPAGMISRYEYRVEDLNGVAIGGDETTGFTSVTLDNPVNPADIVLEIDLSEKPMGDYVLRFRAADTRGLWGSMLSRTITKEAFPVAGFSVVSSILCEESAVVFTNESLDADTYLWDFGDGTTSDQQDPSHIYQEAGEYEVTLTASHTTGGQPSESKILIQVNRVYETLTEAEICEGESYIWQGETYTQTGTYTKVLPSIKGCDSTLVLSLKVNPAYDVPYSGPGLTNTYLVNDSFEDVAVGGLGGWTKLYNGTGDANQKVVDTMAKNGIHSLQLEGAGSWASEYYKPVPAGSGTITIEGWLNVEKALSGLTGGFGLADISVGTWGTRTSRLEFFNGRITATYSGGDRYDIQAFTPGTWYHIRMEHDLAARNYSVYINGTRVSGTSGAVTTDVFPMHPTVTSRQFLLFAGNSGTTKVFFDDLKMYEQKALELCGNELPFIFGSQSITASGTYTENFQSIMGCDSLVTLTLIVKPASSVTKTVEICQGDLPYEFGGQNLTETGEYTGHFTAKNGCDSTVTLTLVVHPEYNTSESISVCAAQLPYTYRGKVIEEAGIYQQTYALPTGCDSIATWTVTVRPEYETSAEVTIMESELPYYFGKQALNEPGTYTQTFLSVYGCDSIVHLTLEILTIVTSPPVAVCNPISVDIEKEGTYKLSQQDVERLAEGTSDLQTPVEELIIKVQPDIFTCQDVGMEVPVAVIVTDTDGQSDTCYTHVTVHDFYVPLVLCKDATLYLDKEGMAKLDVETLHADAYDACGIASISTGKEWYTCSDLGQSSFWVAITDASLNMVVCWNTVTVLDTIAPVIEPVADLIVSALPGKCEATPDYPSVTASDNCQVIELRRIGGFGPGAIFPAGTTLEQWVATDSSGNRDTISFAVTVVTVFSPPAFKPAEDLSVPEGTLVVSLELTDISDGSDCSEDPLILTLDVSGDPLTVDYSFSYSGGSTGTLQIILHENAAGLALITLTLHNPVSNLTFSDTFTLKVPKTSSPPFVVQPPGNLIMKDNQALGLKFSSEKGEIFDDPDVEDVLKLSMARENGGVLPGWIVFRNDSLLARPTAADTGCVNLILAATDLWGNQVHTTFTLCVSSTVNISDTELHSLKLYPNPTTGKVYIALPGSSQGEAEIIVLNAVGQQVFRTKLQAYGRAEINLEQLTSGIYFMRIRTGSISSLEKIILKKEQ